MSLVQSLKRPILTALRPSTFQQVKHALMSTEADAQRGGYEQDIQKDSTREFAARMEEEGGRLRDDALHHVDETARQANIKKKEALDAAQEGAEQAQGGLKQASETVSETAKGAGQSVVDSLKGVGEAIDNTSKDMAKGAKKVMDKATGDGK